MTIFADSGYWIALLNEDDQWHGKARALSEVHKSSDIVTTDEVLTEVLHHFSKYGEHWRGKAVKFVERAISIPRIRVVPQTRESFESGLRLYKERSDKKYSLCDCVSMQRMKKDKIVQVLTFDHHFAQEGFDVLVIDE